MIPWIKKNTGENREDSIEKRKLVRKKLIREKTSATIIIAEVIFPKLVRDWSNN